MKTILAVLALCLAGCAEESYVVPPDVGQSHTGVVNYCDSSGCSDVQATYYYDNTGDLYYWDYPYWVGSNGYFYGGIWHRGFYPGYRGFYSHGRVFVGNRGGFRGSLNHGGHR